MTGNKNFKLCFTILSGSILGLKTLGATQKLGSTLHEKVSSGLKDDAR